jgi:hypothetical protein
LFGIRLSALLFEVFEVFEVFEEADPAPHREQSLQGSQIQFNIHSRVFEWRLPLCFGWKDISSTV